MNNLFAKNKSTMRLTQDEVINHKQVLKYKLTMHIEERPSHGVNTGYVEYLEREIANCDKMLAKKAA